MEEQQFPFQLTLDYQMKQRIKTNFTINMQLERQWLVPINCAENRNRSCLVELALQIQTDSMSIDIWCQPPAFSYADFYRPQPVHTCLLPARNSMEQPSISMIVYSHDVGVIQTWATANFSYSSQYNIEKRGDFPIDIAPPEESILSRSVRYINNGNDDAIESELEEPECTSIIQSFNNGK